MIEIEEELTSDLQIVSYLHCGLCLKEYYADEDIKTKMSPRDYAMTETGFTRQGLQIWCKRHECNVAHIDFQGQKHPANLNANVSHLEEGSA